MNRRVLSDGERVRFTYHCWESPLSQDAEAWRHTKLQAVVVVGRLPNVDEAEVGGPMCRIRFKDGFETDAFRDEVRRLRIPTPKEG